MTKYDLSKLLVGMKKMHRRFLFVFPEYEAPYINEVMIRFSDAVKKRMNEINFPSNLKILQYTTLLIFRFSFLDLGITQVRIMIARNEDHYSIMYNMGYSNSKLMKLILDYLNKNIDRRTNRCLST